MKARILATVTTVLAFLETSVVKLKKLKEVFGKVELKTEPAVEVVPEVKSAPAEVQVVEVKVEELPAVEEEVIELVEVAPVETPPAKPAEEPKKRRARKTSNRSKLAAAKKPKSKK